MTKNILMKNLLSLTLQNSLKLPLPSSRKNLIIKKDRNFFLLRKIYFIVSEDLKKLIVKKNYLYIYFPIKSINQKTNNSYMHNSNSNQYKICLNKEEIINEVKLYLGIEKNLVNFKFHIYDGKLNLITNDKQLFYNINNKIKYIIR